MNGLIGKLWTLLLLGAFSWWRPKASGGGNKDPGPDLESEEYEEGRYRAVVDAATDGIITMTVDSTIESFNAAAQRIFGYSASEALGMSLTTLMPERFREAHENGLRHYLRGGEARVVGKGAIELAGLRKDGTEFPLDLSVSEAWLGDRRLFMGIVRDVSERKRYGAKVEESERRFRQLFDHSVDALLVHDTDGKIVDCNPEACRSLGYTRGELLSLRVADFATNLVSGEEKRSRGEKTLWQRTLSEEPGSGAEGLHFGQHRRKDGATFPVEVRVGSVDYEGERLILASARDITERRQAERRLETQHAVAATLAAADTKAGAVSRVLSEICEGLGWEVGEFWTVEHEANGEVLRCMELWRAEGKASLEYEEFTRSLALPKGTGLSGRAWESGEPVWIPDITEQWGFLHSGAVVGAGLRAALAFPVLGDSGVLGVMGFFGGSTREFNPEIVEMLSTMGSQIGRFIDHKHAEHELRDSEERLRALTEATVEGIVISEDGKILETNGAFDRMLGYERDELIGTSVLDLVDADTLELVRSSIATDNRETYGGRAVRKDGSVFDVDIHGEVSSYKGRSVRVTAVRDITERKASERRLRESEEKYRTILESIEDGYFEVDLAGNLTFFNDALCEILDYPSDELLGMNNRDYTDEENARRVYGFFNSVYESGRASKGFDWELTRGDGERIPVEASVSRVEDSGKIVGFRGILRDVTERRLAQQELERARDAAEDANRAKSEFLANMSHEIRTPMNGVIGMTGLLLDTDLSAEQREYAETVRLSGENLLTVINEILDFSKIEAGRMELEVTEFELLPTVENVAALLAERAQDKDLELTAYVEPGAPGVLIGDAGRLGQILTNLVGNAVKFTEHGEVNLRATVQERTSEGVVMRFEVSDTGIGIAPEHLSRMFRSFSQADASTTRRYGGTGLGLAISKQLVELMGGEIDVESQSGLGSTFFFTVPLGRPVGDSARVSKRRADLHGLRVLVVDDNETNRKILHEQLTSWELPNKSVEGGLQALEELRVATLGNEPYDLVILDMQMPEMDGIELARAIRANQAVSDPELLLLTSMGSHGDAEEVRRAGIVARLTKPVRRSQLFDCLASVMGAVEEQEALPDRELPGPAAKSNGETGSRARILLAEDNPINQKVAIRMLEKISYRVDAVANGEEAVEAVSRIPYAAVLMDVQMPEMDGHEATAEIRRREGAGSRTPIIAMTANAMSGDRERALQSGMDDYISKPVKPGTLAAILERWVFAEPSQSGDPQLPAVEAMTPAAIDAAQIQELRALQEEGEPDIVAEFVGLFVGGTPPQLAELDEAIRSGEERKVARVSHTLKGSSANMGARHMSELCARLQEVGGAGDLPRARELYGALEEEYERVHRELEDLRRGN